MVCDRGLHGAGPRGTRCVTEGYTVCDRGVHSAGRLHDSVIIAAGGTIRRLRRWDTDFLSALICVICG
jgi:hypothetical protein